MNTALSWIKAYVKDLDVTNQEYCDGVTLSGTKIEGYEILDKNLDKIVVGQIDKIEPHPDADKLIICQVNIGNSILQIVTGAKNVKEGDKVPVVLDGGKVAGGHQGETPPEDGILIKAGKLRGIESQGMMCSIEELGSSREMYPEAPEDGIYIFTKEVEIGGDAIEVLGRKDTIFEYEVTSNRVDCYSVLGIAREVAATFKKEFIAPKVEIKENQDRVENYIQVRVEDSELCPRYVARVCTNIKIEPSPKWMQLRLAASGIRPINNLVDITNYVMEEYGQPMHAYDMDMIKGKEVIVRRAKDGEEFQTLDGQMRKLDQDVLMICDGEKEIGIAGIMGGENSKISDNVTTILLEAATFHGANIRKSAKRVGIRTDASGKFEKGLDPRNALAAMNRACQLIQELGCGEVVSGVVDVCAPLKELNRIAFEPDRINALLGTNLKQEDMLAIFKPLEIEYEESTKELIIPSFRQDLEGFADIAEEVARFYGYDKIATTLPNGEATTGKLSFKLRIEKKAKEVAEFCGFSQAMCYSFESPKVFDKLLIPQDSELRNTVTILNPLGEDYSIMRTLPVNGILTSLATNFNRRNKNVKLYELANIYLPKQIPVTELPNERMQFTLGFYGEGDFFTMKGYVEQFLETVGMREKCKCLPESKKTFLHPGRQAELMYGTDIIGYMGEIHPEVGQNYELNTKAYIAVLDMPIILEKVTFERKYKGIAKYPAVSRDISMTVPKAILAGDIEEVIAKCGDEILENYELFDLYEGSQIPEGFKSMAYAITFRAQDKTLEENDITVVMEKILTGLEQLGAQLRK